MRHTSTGCKVSECKKTQLCCLATPTLSLFSISFLLKGDTKGDKKISYVCLCKCGECANLTVQVMYEQRPNGFTYHAGWARTLFTAH